MRHAKTILLTLLATLLLGLGLAPMALAWHPRAPRPTPSWSAPRACSAGSTSWPTSPTASRSTSGTRPLGPEHQRDPHSHVPRRQHAPPLLLPASSWGCRCPARSCSNRGREPGAVWRARRHDHVRQLRPDGPEPGQIRSFDLTFTAGARTTTCAWSTADDVRHDQAVAPRAGRLAPSGARARVTPRSPGRWPGASRDPRGQGEIKPATKNPDGTQTTTSGWASARGRSTSCASSPASCASRRGTRSCGR